jgi:hypothetical protein
MSAMTELHQAIYTRLSTDPALAVGEVDVADEPPNSNDPRSRVVIGDMTEVRGGISSAGSHDMVSYELTATVHVWYRGRSTISALEVMGWVVEALEESILPLPTNAVLLQRYESSVVLREPNWRHIPATFRFVVESPAPVHPPAN